MRALRLVVVAALTAAALTAALPAAAPALEVGQKAPDFTLPGPGNKPVKLGEASPIYQKVQANPLDLLDPDEVLKAVKESGVK